MSENHVHTPECAKDGPFLISATLLVQEPGQPGPTAMTYQFPVGNVPTREQFELMVAEAKKIIGDYGTLLGRHEFLRAVDGNLDEEIAGPDTFALDTPALVA